MSEVVKFLTNAFTAANACDSASFRSLHLLRMMIPSAEHSKTAHLVKAILPLPISWKFNVILTLSVRVGQKWSVIIAFGVDSKRHVLESFRL